MIYGLQEAETGEGSRVAAAITPLTDWSAVSRVADIVATLIQPQIRFDLRDVAVAGGFVLVVEIRASNGIDLHMAANPKGGRFYRRTTNGAVPMSEAEVRDAYFRIGELRASLDQHLYLYDTNDNLVETLPHSGIQSVIWRPDSQAIFFSDDKALYILSIPNGKPRLINECSQSSCSLDDIVWLP